MKKGCKIASSLMTLATFAIPNFARGAVFMAESQSILSSRRSLTGTNELPLSEFLDSTYISDNKNFDLNANFSFYGDPVANYESQFQLYILDANYRLIPKKLHIRAGRSFNMFTANRSGAIDALSVDYFIDKQFKFIAIGGTERDFVRSNTTSQNGFFGGQLQFRTDSVFPFYIAGKYEQRLFDTPQHLGTLSVSKIFPGDWSPELMMNVETNMAPTARVTDATIGMDYYPTYNTTMRWRLLSHETKIIDDVEEPIFAIFSSGRLNEGSVQLEYQTASNVSLSGSLAVDEYPQDATTRLSGQRFEFDAKYSPKPWAVTAGAYSFQSYGGKANGAKIRYKYKTRREWTLETGADATYYEKITAEKGWATNVEVFTSRWFGKHFKFSSGGELNNNTFLQYDVRLMAKLTYLALEEF